MSDATPRKSLAGDPSLDLAARRTGMAFQRTRLAAERTLMAVMRTSISLISFGFTIFQFFSKLKGAGISAGGEHASRNFGRALVWLGIGMLLVGIVYHVMFIRALGGLRQSMKADGLVHGESPFPPSMTLIVAFLLLAIGVTAILSMTFQTGPFGYPA